MSPGSRCWHTREPGLTDPSACARARVHVRVRVRVRMGVLVDVRMLVRMAYKSGAPSFPLVFYIVSHALSLFQTH